MQELAASCLFHRRMQLHLFSHVVSDTFSLLPSSSSKGAPPMLEEYYLLQQRSARSRQLRLQRRRADLQICFLLREVALAPGGGFAMESIAANDRLNRAVAADRDLRLVRSIDRCICYFDYYCCNWLSACLYMHRLDVGAPVQDAIDGFVEIGNPTLQHPALALTNQP